MTFSQRLKRFLIGIGIGLILSFIFFQDKTDLLTSWLPGNRVIHELTNFTWQQSETMNCYLSCNNLNEEQLKKELVDANVNFSMSKPREQPRSYAVFIDEEKWMFSIVDSTVVINNTPKDCNC